MFRERRAARVLATVEPPLWEQSSSSAARPRVSMSGAYPPDRGPSRSGPDYSVAVWPTVSMMGAPRTLAEALSAVHLTGVVSRGATSAGRNIIAEVPFERESMRHIPALILNLMGSLRLPGRGAKKFRVGPSSRWKIYKSSAMGSLVCTCKNVHAWYFVEFDPEFADDEAKAFSPEASSLSSVGR